MTGGQASPTMDLEDRGTTAPYGQVEPPFDLCRLAEAAGASFVARGTAATIRPLERLIKQGIQHHGFSFIEAVVPCPTEYGKRNPPAGAVAMLEDTKARSVTVSRAAKMAAEELEGKIVTGVLHDDPDAPEFQEAYAAISARAQKAAAAARKGRPRRLSPPATEAAACGLPTDLAAATSSPAGETAEQVPPAVHPSVEDAEAPDTGGLPCEGGE